jgi:hypothetical protein
MALRLTHHVTEMSSRNLPGGVKRGRCIRLKSPPSVSRLSRKGGILDACYRDSLLHFLLIGPQQAQVYGHFFSLQTQSKLRPPWEGDDVFLTLEMRHLKLAVCVGMCVCVALSSWTFILLYCNTSGLAFTSQSLQKWLIGGHELYATLLGVLQYDLQEIS